MDEKYIFTVKIPIHRGNKLYQIGSEIVLSESEAQKVADHLDIESCRRAPDEAQVLLVEDEDRQDLQELRDQVERMDVKFEGFINKLREELRESLGTLKSAVELKEELGTLKSAEELKEELGGLKSVLEEKAQLLEDHGKKIVGLEEALAAVKQQLAEAKTKPASKEKPPARD